VPSQTPALPGKGMSYSLLVTAALEANLDHAVFFTTFEGPNRESSISMSLGSSR
jgi:hypothetical protein